MTTLTRWEHVKALFQRALVHPAALEAADESPSVVEEVRRLIDADAQAGSSQESSTVAQRSSGSLVAGRFRIVSLLGRGGMGLVYRAEDAVLSRHVALKFLGSTPELERLKREARAAAALNHPNICVVHEIDEDHGQPFIVMELLEGQTLRQRIGGNPLPMDQLLDWAEQIADGLEAAHRAGIVHGDIKSGNIFITVRGQAKILGFGMLRERGEDVDARTDLFSLGAVLYEMATGRQAFASPATGIPAELDRVIGKALEEDRDLRYQSAAELLADVKRLKRDRKQKLPRAGRPLKQRWPWAFAGALAAGIAAALWVPRGPNLTDRLMVTLDVDLGPEVSLPPVLDYGRQASTVIISPDGTRLVYVANVGGGPSKLFTRRLDQPSATELPGTDGAFFPFFSLDSRWVVYNTPSYTLKKTLVQGGVVVPLGDMHAFGGSWAEDDSIITSRLHGDGMVRIPSSGGSATPVTDHAGGDVHVYPHVLPGRRAALFTFYRGAALDVDRARIEVVSEADHRAKTLVRGGTSPHYVPLSNSAGHLIYSNKGTLYAIPLDLNRLETQGTPVAVLDGVAYERDGATAHFDISRNGTLVYRRASGSAEGVRTLQWLNAAARYEPLLAKPGAYSDPSLSPDGKRLAVSVVEASVRDIWVFDQQRDAMTRLTFGGGGYMGGYLHPIWSPNGAYVVFGTYVGSMFWTRSDGSRQPQALTRENEERPWSFSPDGKRLAYSNDVSNANSGGNLQIWTVPVEDSGGQLTAGKPEQFRKSQFTDCCPMFSPDGRWLAYVSNESGRDEVYVRPFPPPPSGQGGQWQISNDGGDSAMWSSRVHDLLFHSGDQIMAVKYSVRGDVFVAEKPRVWLAKLGGATDFDLSRDGTRLAVVTPAAAQEAPKPEHEVTMVFNFGDELRRRVPLK